ncbi:Uncharacterised protein [Vibrio cholerae]|nr:Uncharacterised protein [Vibrio cholerae]CSC31132.1 Uncharacterised protein [Vibrio cholerae]CSC92389.1 Uncharacterised protein [Vibrio cholerae]
MWIVSRIGNLIGNTNQITHQSPFGHNLRIGINVGSTGRVFGQIGQIGKATDIFQLLTLLKIFGQGNEIERFTRLQNRFYPVKNQTMRAAVEVLSHHVF